MQSTGSPGGNVDRPFGNELAAFGKAPVGLLKEAFPKITQITALWNPDRADNVPEVEVMKDAAEQLGLEFRVRSVRTRDELAIKLDAIGWDGTQSILDANDPLIGSEARTIAEQAARLKLPVLSGDRSYVDAGGLMSYGPSYRDLHRRAAEYVDKILKGAKAGDLPVEQPTNFELVINRKAANALGITLPYSVLIQATEVIE